MKHPVLSLPLFVVIFFVLMKLLTSTSEASVIAATPPMGWNSWNQFGCQVNEKLILEIADTLIKNKMKEAGYDYVILDDCWQAENRDKNGNLQSDPVKFPHGIPFLANQIHEKGLKFGIYTSVGAKTCEGYPGSLDHEDQDAKLFASWGVDYLKDDFCTRKRGWWPWWNYRARYQKMSESLRSTGRPILFSICNWGWGNVWTWAPSIANMWRTSSDIKPKWEVILKIIDAQVGKEKFAGPQHWNDPDVLEVGVDPLTEIESKSHFSMWAMLAAPLIAGNDLRTMSDPIHKILTAPEVIEINQDSGGFQAHRVWRKRDLEIWRKQLSEVQTVAVALFNRGSRPAEITAHWKDIGLLSGTASVRDLWTRKNLGQFTDEFTSQVPPHGIVLVKIKTIQGKLPS